MKRSYLLPLVLLAGCSSAAERAELRAQLAKPSEYSQCVDRLLAHRLGSGLPVPRCSELAGTPNYSGGERTPNGYVVIPVPRVTLSDPKLNSMINPTPQVYTIRPTY